VARRASAEGRIIITFDKDFGELAVRHGLGGQAGVVLLRFVPESPDHAAHLVLQALAGIGPIEGRLVVIERERVRLRALGSGPVDRGSPAGPDGRSAGMIPRLPRRRRRAPATMSAEAQHASGTILHQKTMSKELASPWANSPWAASSSPA
jgi:hypothetical protein